MDDQQRTMVDIAPPDRVAASPYSRPIVTANRSATVDPMVNPILSINQQQSRAKVLSDLPNAEHIHAIQHDSPTISHVQDRPKGVTFLRVLMTFVGMAVFAAAGYFATKRFL